MPARHAWTSTLPKLRVKDVIRNCPAVADTGKKRDTYPIHLEGYELDMQGFEHHLRVDRSVGPASVNINLLNMKRLFHMLETSAAEPINAATASNIGALVAFYSSGVFKELFALPLLDLRHAWSRNIVVALKYFCEWQVSSSTVDALLDETGILTKYASVVSILKDALNRGYTKRSTNERQKRLNVKRGEAWDDIQKLPPRDANFRYVQTAMRILAQIERRSADLAELPKVVQTEANSAILFIIFCNGFAGRCMEWPLLSMAHFSKQIADGKDFIVCDKHKTSHVYGNLSKWLAPGTIASMMCYGRLPRRDGVDTFLVPTTAGQAINVPGALRRFGEKYILDEFNHPKVTILRKMYHTKLMELTATHEVIVLCKLLSFYFLWYGHTLKSQIKMITSNYST